MNGEDGILLVSVKVPGGHRPWYTNETYVLNKLDILGHSIYDNSERRTTTFLTSGLFNWLKEFQCVTPSPGLKPEP